MAFLSYCGVRDVWSRARHRCRRGSSGSHGVWRATDDEICQVRFAENLRSQLSSYTDPPIVLPVLMDAVSNSLNPNTSESRCTAR